MTDILAHEVVTTIKECVNGQIIIQNICSLFLHGLLLYWWLIYVTGLVSIVTFVCVCVWEREMVYLMTHSTHFIYGYLAADIWLRTVLIVRKETHCRHIGYSYRLTARVLLYAPSHRQDNTYHGLCYTSRGALAGTRNSSMGSPHEGSIRQPITPWANALPLSYVPLCACVCVFVCMFSVCVTTFLNPLS